MSSIITIIIAVISYCPYYVFCFLLLLIQGDIKISLGLKKSHKNFSCPYWNVNNLVAHNMQKVSLFEEYNVTHTYDLICFSEAYFDSSVESDDVSLRISGCKLFWTDHYSNTKIGGFCIYYKEPLALKTITISYLQQSLLCEVILDKIKGYISIVYRSPSQNRSDFQHFLSVFEQLLINIRDFKPNIIVLVSNYNTRSNSWWGFNTSTFEDTQIDSPTLSYELH